MESAARAEAARGELVPLRGPHLVCDDDHEYATGRVVRPETYSGLRAVRTFAMLSIVGYHIAWKPIFGVAFGLTSLQVILCALAARSAPRRAFRDFAARRASRLLLPWALWSLVYVGFELTRAWRDGDSPTTRFADFPWAAGGSFHLWFLPFGFAASLLAACAARAVSARVSATAGTAFATTAALALLTTNAACRRALDPPAPFELWLDGAPAVAFGVAVAAALGVERRTQRLRLLGAIALAAALAPGLVGRLGSPSALELRYAIAVPLACLGFALRVREHRVLVLLASYNLGVYLVHMLAIRVVDHVPGVQQAPVLLRTALVYLTCLAAVWAIRRVRVAGLS